MHLKKDFFYPFAFRYGKKSGIGGINDKLWSCSGGGSGFGNEVMFAAKDRAGIHSDGYLEISFYLNHAEANTGCNVVEIVAGLLLNLSCQSHQCFLTCSHPWKRM